MIDQHCHIHLDNSDFQGTINRAKFSGVKAILNIFEISRQKDFEKFDEILSLDSKNLRIFAAAGIHPLETENLKIEEGEKILKSCEKKIIAFGETGLDLFKAENKNQQLKFFEMHCNLAKEFKKPIIIHQRNCHIEELIEIVKKFSIKCVFHCWTLSPKELEKALENDCFISFSGITTFDKAFPIVESAKICPLDRIFLETDSPFLAPVPFRGKKNEPAFVKEVYKFVAKIKEISMEELKKNVEKNFQNFFSVQI
jgi:TatD DNase family protein